MRGTFYDYYNLIVRGNWGFSSSMSKGMLFNGYVAELNKREATKRVKKIAYNDSVISVNETFIELVDPANRVRGLSSFFGILGLIPMLIGMGYLIYFSYVDFYELSTFFIFFNTAIILIFLMVSFPIANMIIRWNIFRKTHYPMRFNRKNRKVYVFSQDMGVVCMNWDDIHFFISKSTSAEGSS